MEVVALLYNIRSLYNVGSIFRTADGAGVKKIYLCGITPEPFDRFGRKRQEFSKVALRAEEYVSWEKIGHSSPSKDTKSLIRKLNKEGFIICAVEQDRKSIPYDKLSIKSNKLKFALIVGDEVRGLSKSILKLSDYVLEIPMRGKKESLNVSVAFGIVAYEIMGRQRR